MNFILNWLLSALAIVITAYILPGVIVRNYGVALITALVIGIVAVLIGPFLLFLTLPINILTLGLFTFVIEAVVVLIAARIVPGFEVNGFGNALIFAVILTFINVIFFAVFH
jgi:putative membrane protein